MTAIVTSPQQDESVDAVTMAKILGVSTDAFYRAIRAGRIPCIRISKRVIRCRVSEVLAAVRVGQASQEPAA
jgi:predicted site-specific integrase-resolvase